MCQVIRNENTEKDGKGPALEDTGDEGPAGNVGDEDHEHVREHPEHWKVSSSLVNVFLYT